jgi:hypothetical protein
VVVAREERAEAGEEGGFELGRHAGAPPRLAGEAVGSRAGGEEGVAGLAGGRLRRKAREEGAGFAVRRLGLVGGLGLGAAADGAVGGPAGVGCEPLGLDREGVGDSGRGRAGWGRRPGVRS